MFTSCFRLVTLGLFMALCGNERAKFAIVVYSENCQDVSSVLSDCLFNPRFLTPNRCFFGIDSGIFENVGFL